MSSFLIIGTCILNASTVVVREKLGWGCTINQVTWC